MFSNSELADMHFVYGLARGNGSEAKRLYREMYPNRRQPASGRFFQNLHLRLGVHGSFSTPRGGQGHATHLDIDTEVLEMVEENPNTSTRAVASALGTSKSSVWRVLKEQCLYPYHLQPVQVLYDGDHALRLDYCQWVMRQHRRERLFHQKILFTDEATFTRDGIFNTKNSHVWADENPNAKIERGHQRRFKINVWAGLIGGYFIGPYILPASLSGRNYLIFLQEVLDELLEDLPLELRTEMFFQHDGAPAHFTTEVRQHLDETYPNRWIGRGGPISWPPRSPDLTPLDFYLWGALKSLVYNNEPIESEMELVGRLSAAIHEINPLTISAANKSIIKRSRLCISEGGGHFEQLLK